MKQKIINEISSNMVNYLNNEQLEQLKETLDHSLYNCEIVTSKHINESITNEKFLELFITAKKIEGCSVRTTNYYEMILKRLINHIKYNVKKISTDDLRNYLSDYQQNSNASKVSIDNIRRILSSFFNWLESENYILKSPMRRIHKIKTVKVVKETYSSEVMQIIRDNCIHERDIAIIDLLASTGMRVGELVLLNRFDIDFNNKECIVFGKGDKERRVYFDSTTKIHLIRYLNSRKDKNDALFVSKLKPYNRLQISGVEIVLRKLGRKIGVARVHPHKFRRTLATNAIDKGMPVEQVQKLLGHTKIDTTMQYAMVDQNNVKNSYRKYLD